MVHPVFYEIIAWSKGRRGELVELTAAILFFTPLYIGQLALLPQK
jgi:hypothetical protein